MGGIFSIYPPKSVYLKFFVVVLFTCGTLTYVLNDFVIAMTS